jgi:hypothetical protein
MTRRNDTSGAIGCAIATPVAPSGALEVAPSALKGEPNAEA